MPCGSSRLRPGEDYYDYDEVLPDEPGVDHNHPIPQHGPVEPKPEGECPRCDITHQLRREGDTR